MTASEWWERGAPFEVRVTAFPETAFIQLIGEMDMTATGGVARFTEDFLASECNATTVVLDLSEVSFGDLGGVRSLSDTCDRLRQEGFEVSVCGVRATMRLFLEISGVMLPPTCARTRPAGPGPESARPRVYGLVDGRVKGPRRTG
jgi:anti-anti-sigma factor